MTTFVEVSLPVPLDRTFSYRVPQRLEREAEVGRRVLVPFRNQHRAGIILAVSTEAPEGSFRVRDIADVVDSEPFVPPPQRELAEWIARYYHAPIGEALDLAIPSALSPEKSQLTYELIEPLDLDAADELDRRRSSVDSQPDGELRLSEGGIARQLLMAVQEAGASCDARTLLGNVPGATAADLDAVVRAGLLKLADLRAERISTRTETLVTACMSGGDESRLGDKQRATVAFLREHGETSYTELRELYGVNRQTLRTLTGRDLIECRDVEVSRDPFATRDVALRDEEPVLTDTQRAALDQLAPVIDAGAFAPFVLHGVTGSGKTEVYLRAIRRARAAGRDALVLLPEISLTPQFVNAVRSALPDEVSVLHSQLTPAEKADSWRRIQRGDVHVVIGARSALFAPLRNLGLIVVDEEHDGSFKQNDGVRYNARDCAIWLARRVGCPVVLGSATPALETIRHAREGRFSLLEMPERVQARPMPEIHFIDLRQNRPVEDGPMLLTEPMIDAVKSTVRRGEQVILFLNRRGFAPSVICRGCGETVDCASCDISMTYHRRGDVVRCHYCGATHLMPTACPTCGSPELGHQGAGTEQVEETAADMFPEARVLRLDRDSARGPRMQKILSAFRRREADILIGTQMVTKGHDFPDVTLVGVLNGDQSLHFPDFRGGERTFQLLTQVAGRAGRGERTGEVLIQSWNPDHYVLQAVRDADYERMATAELRLRHLNEYPPFAHLALYRFRAPEYADVARASETLAATLRKALPATVDVVGPVDAPIARVRSQYRRQLMLRSADRAALHRAVSDTNDWLGRRSGEVPWGKLRVTVDMDPYSML